MSETWVKAQCPDDLVCFLGFSFLKIDRKCKRSGGIEVYVRDELFAKIFVTFASLYYGQPEFMLVRISAAGCRFFLLAVVYHPPEITS